MIGSRNSPVSGTPGSHFLLVSGILGSFDSRCPGYRGVLTPRCPRHRGSRKSPVSGTPGVVSLTVHCFFLTSGHFLHPLKQQSIKKQCGSTISYTNAFGSFLNKFLTSLFLLRLPVSQTPESRFKTWIAAQNVFKIPNGVRICLIGIGGAVWRKKTRAKNSHATVFLIS